MKHVNTVDMEQLSDDQIAAARARRMKERYKSASLIHLNRQLHILLLQHMMSVSRYRFTIAGLLAHCLGSSLLLDAYIVLYAPKTCMDLVHLQGHCKI